MLAEIKRKEELKRVNMKIKNSDSVDDVFAQAEARVMQNYQDEPSRDSNLLNTGKLLDGLGQRDLDSDEMDEEMMNEHLEDSLSTLGKPS